MAMSWESVEQYLEAQPGAARERLEELRAAIREVLPDAEEVISHNILCFKAGGKPVIYLAGWATHLSVYPQPHADEALLAELEPYIALKGTLRFPLNRPMPTALVARAAAALRAEI